MGKFQISEKLQLEHLLFIDKAYHKKSFLVTLLLFVVCEKKPSIDVFLFNAFQISL